jgi:tRNA (cytidine/uridine-2'-O-)-methyltransferase
LVKPLGFELSDKHLKRAGLDYHEYADLTVHEDWGSCTQALQGKRLFALTTKGSTRHSDLQFEDEDVFVFGPESRGLPEDIRAQFAPEHRVRLPMLPHSRSLNLSNSAAILLYEAWRQVGFPGGT